MPSGAKDKIAEAFACVDASAQNGGHELYHDDCCLCLAKPFGLIERRRGKQEVVALNEAYRRAFPKLRFRLETLLEEGDKVAAQWVVTAEPAGEFVEPITRMQIRPSTARVSVEGISFYRFEEGRIIEKFHLHDELGLLLQLGVDPGALPVVDFSPDAPSEEASTVLGTNSPNKELIRAFMAEVVNEKDDQRREAAARRFIAPDMHLYGPDAGTVDADLVGIEKFLAGHRKFRRAFPEFEFVTQDMVEEGNRVALRWSVANAWHSGPLQVGDVRLSPTGNNANVHGAAVCEIVDGKIVSKWQLSDAASLLRQLMS